MVLRTKLSIGIIGFVLIFVIGTTLGGSFLTAPANQSIGELPSNLAGNSVTFASESGSTIHGWFIPGKRGTGAVALMHGVRANRLSMLDRARLLSNAGYAVLLFDFQAHGESEGKHITFGHLESKDARAAIDFLRAHVPGEKIGLIGVSMGGAASLLASPPLDVNAMILEMVYPTINQAISNRLTMRLGGWASLLTPLLSWQLKPRLGVDADALRPIDSVSSVRAAKLFVAGADDQHTTVEESRELFNAANVPKEMWVVSGAKHVDLYQAARNEYEGRVLDFFARYLKSAK